MSVATTVLSGAKGGGGLGGTSYATERSGVMTFVCARRWGTTVRSAWRWSTSLIKILWICLAPSTDRSWSSCCSAASIPLGMVLVNSRSECSLGSSEVSSGCEYADCVRIPLPDTTPSGAPALEHAERALSFLQKGLRRLASGDGAVFFETTEDAAWACDFCWRYAYGRRLLCGGKQAESNFLATGN